MALTDEERELIHLAFGQGPSALVDEGMDYPDIHEFMNRSDVQEEFRLLSREFEQQDALNALVKFSTRRQLIRLKDKAVSVLAQALHGPEYLRFGDNVVMDAAGRSVLRNPEPTLGQRQTAQDLLDRLNVISDKQILSPGAVNVKVLFKNAEEKTVEIQTDKAHATEEQRSLSRERVRNVIEIMSKDMANMKEVAAKQIGGPKSPKKPTKAKKKKAVKKTGVLRMRKPHGKAKKG